MMARERFLHAALVLAAVIALGLTTGALIRTMADAPVVNVTVTPEPLMAEVR